MKKFWAMLQDSFREAIDGWIFYMMLALIGILIVIVASVSVEPMPAAKGMGKVISGDAFRMVSPDRGQSKKLFMMTYEVKTSDIQIQSDNPARPWECTSTLLVEFTGSALAPAAVEVDDPKKPTTVKPVEGGGLFSHPFKEAVRIWASRDNDRIKPKYSDELAFEFLKYQLRAAASLNVTSVEKRGETKFLVSCSGVSKRSAWPHTTEIFFGAVPVGFLEGRPLALSVYLIEDILLNTFGAWVLMLAGVIVTAAFIPNMMRKGAIDLLLTKPVSRPLILIYKYLGGLLFVFLLTVLAVGGVWLAVGLRTGVWTPGLLYCTLGITFYFAILYACSTLFGVLTRNAIVCIVVTIVFWFIVWIIGYSYSQMLLVNNLQNLRHQATAPADPANPADDTTVKEEEAVPQGVVRVFKFLNSITPRTKDLDKLTTRLISQDLLSEADQKQSKSAMSDVNWTEVLIVATVWIVFFLALALLRFVTRSY